MGILQLFPIILLCLISKAESLHTSLESRVLDGHKLHPENHRHLVFLEIRDNKNDVGGSCSGSVIDSRWVVSAAHCFKPSTQIVIISHMFKDGLIINVGDGEEVHLHPKYDMRKDVWRMRPVDIALVKTRHAFNDVLKPIALATKMPHMGQMASIAGYGITEAHHRTPREGHVKITTCLSGQKDMICSYGKTRAASGDSGGPLVINIHLYGVMSTSCHWAAKPPCETGIASVAHNYKWITKIMENN